YALPLGERGTLLLVQQQEGELWDVVRSGRDRALDVIASSLSLPFAQGVAEDEARRSNAAVLSRRDAPWRQAPASPKQQAQLTRWRRWRAGMTKGEASDAISAYIAQRAARNLRAVAS